MILAKLSIYNTRKNIKSAYGNTKFQQQTKSMLQLGMMNLIFLINHTLFQTFKIVLNTLLKNIKL